MSRHCSSLSDFILVEALPLGAEIAYRRAVDILGSQGALRAASRDISDTPSESQPRTAGRS
jgi:hypothetical protein